MFVCSSICVFVQYLFMFVLGGLENYRPMGCRKCSLQVSTIPESSRSLPK